MGISAMPHSEQLAEAPEAAEEMGAGAEDWAAALFARWRAPPRWSSSCCLSIMVGMPHSSQPRLGAGEGGGATAGAAAGGGAAFGFDLQPRRGEEGKGGRGESGVRGGHEDNGPRKGTHTSRRVSKKAKDASAHWQGGEPAAARKRKEGRGGGNVRGDCAGAAGATLGRAGGVHVGTGAGEGPPGVWYVGAASAEGFLPEPPLATAAAAAARAADSPPPSPKRSFTISRSHSSSCEREEGLETPSRCSGSRSLPRRVGR